MKKILTFASLCAALFFTACEEWGPVFTLAYEEPDASKIYDEAFMNSNFGERLTIASLASMYKSSTGGTPIQLSGGWIKGQVISSDASGNIYRTMYIQDETGGIELKTGRTNMSNEYSRFQWVYVNLDGLTLGMYGGKTGNYGGSGMIQLGLKDESGEYETAYVDLPVLVDGYLYKGPAGSAVSPVVLSEKQLPSSKDTQAKNSYIGTYVELQNLRYGNEVFALLYRTYTEDTKNSSNRIFLSDAAWGITTWALTKDRMGRMLESGVWDSAQLGNSGDYNYGTVGDHRSVSGMNGSTYGDIERNAYSVSHYFKMGSTDIQVRSSGYARFADEQIPSALLDGTARADMRGILTMYQGGIQFTLIDLEGVSVKGQ